MTIAFTDLHYSGEGARAACIVAAEWSDATPIEERVVEIASVNPYRPGAFYERARFVGLELHLT